MMGFLNLENNFNSHEELSLRIITVISAERGCKTPSHFASKETKI